MNKDVKKFKIQTIYSIENRVMSNSDSSKTLIDSKLNVENIFDQLNKVNEETKDKYQLLYQQYCDCVDFISKILKENKDFRKKLGKLHSDRFVIRKQEDKLKILQKQKSEYSPIIVFKEQHQKIVSLTPNVVRLHEMINEDQVQFFSPKQYSVLSKSPGEIMNIDILSNQDTFYSSTLIEQTPRSNAKVANSTNELFSAEEILNLRNIGESPVQEKQKIKRSISINNENTNPNKIVSNPVKKSISINSKQNSVKIQSKYKSENRFTKNCPVMPKNNEIIKSGAITISNKMLSTNNLTNPRKNVANNRKTASLNINSASKINPNGKINIESINTINNNYRNQAIISNPKRNQSVNLVVKTPQNKALVTQSSNIVKVHNSKPLITNEIKQLIVERRKVSITSQSDESIKDSNINMVIKENSKQEEINTSIENILMKIENREKTIENKYTDVAMKRINEIRNKINRRMETRIEKRNLLKNNIQISPHSPFIPSFDISEIEFSTPPPINIESSFDLND